MKIWTSKGRMNKQTAYQVVFDVIPKTSAIMLAGPQQGCVRYGLQCGVFTESTNLVIPERCRSALGHIKRYVREEYPFPHKCSIYHGDLSDMVLNKPVDFAYFDFFGNLNRDLETWLKKELLDRLLPNSDLCFTFCAQKRGNRYIINKVKNAESLYDLLWLRKPERQLCEGYIKIFEEILQDFSYDVEIHPYRDSVSPMVVFKIVKINRIKREEDMSTQNVGVSELVEKYFEANGNYDKMRGWHRRVTCFIQRAGIDSGSKKEDYVYRTIKRLITMQGGDASFVLANSKS